MFLEAGEELRVSFSEDRECGDEGYSHEMGAPNGRFGECLVTAEGMFKRGLAGEVQKS